MVMGVRIGGNGQRICRRHLLARVRGCAWLFSTRRTQWGVDRQGRKAGVDDLLVITEHGARDRVDGCWRGASAALINFQGSPSDDPEPPSPFGDTPAAIPTLAAQVSH
jgi:hypothetical protein